MLYSVFRIGNATNNITWESYLDVVNKEEVDWAVPISLGDSHKGFRVMGTNKEFWWASLHQPSSVKILSETTIHSSMLTPLLLMTAAFALFSVLIFLMKYNIELIKIKTKGLDRL